MTNTVCQLNSVQVGAPSTAFGFLPRFFCTAILSLSLALASCSSPRVPAPIVDRSSKVPPVVIVSSVGQSKPASNSTTPAPSSIPRPLEVSPAIQAPREPSKPTAEPQSPTVSAKPIRNPQIISSTRTDIPSGRTEVSNTRSDGSSGRTEVSNTRSDGSSGRTETANARTDVASARASQAAQSNDSRQSPTQESKSTDAKRDDQKANSDPRTTSTSPDTKDQDSLNSAKPAVNTDIEWIWPADGKAVSTFSGGKGGIRIEGQSGDPILAIGDGKVIFAGQGPKGYGNLLIVRHEGELLSVYAHNRALLVQEGSQVKRGQKIAEMGDSGADRTQLGFELRRNGRPVDPRSALPQR
jgi:murein DD-endopeptidase MepM/ murein hydrolase activator NlpD